MDLLKIALLQIAPTGTLSGNLEKGIACCRRAKEMGADIALFPEMWSNGYNIITDRLKNGRLKLFQLTVILSMHSGILRKSFVWLWGSRFLKSMMPAPATQ